MKLLFVLYASQAFAQMSFYPMTPCRVADTRTSQPFTGAFGPPALIGGQSRDFPIPQSACAIPFNALAYSFNVTVIPSGFLGFLTAWPAGIPQPKVSTLNALQGQIVGNAAIVVAGTNGAVSLYASDPTDVVIDVNGYFALPSSTMSIIVNGQPQDADTINFQSGDGVSLVCGRDGNNPRQVNCHLDADKAVMLSRSMDQHADDHSLIGSSHLSIPGQPTGGSPGLIYNAFASPSLKGYAPGQYWVFAPDVPTVPGATLNIDQLGPLPIQGSCMLVCWLLSTGSALVVQ